MGFFKFLKKEKKKEDFDELDLPPLPPMGSNADSDDFDKLPELPELPDWDKDLNSSSEEMPKFDFPEMNDSFPQEQHDEMPNFPQFPKIDDDERTEPVPSIKSPSSVSILEPSVEEIEPEEDMPDSKQELMPVQQEQTPRIGGRLFSRESFRERPTGKTIYVRVDNFKAMLGTINLVRNDLKKSDGSLMKLETIKNSKDKSFDKVKSSLDDLQKKLIFIDKTLFKGE